MTKLHPGQAAALERAQELGPEGLGFGRADGQADDLAPPVGVDRHRDHRGNRDDPTALADLQIGRVEPDIGPVAGERAFEELADALVDLLAPSTFGLGLAEGCACSRSPSAKPSTTCQRTIRRCWRRLSACTENTTLPRRIAARI